MKELMDLLTRVVVAFEKIAEPKTSGCGGDCKCEKTETVEPIKDVVRDYDIIADQPGGRNVLIDMCKTKGIEVPKGIRTTTIAKLLKEGVNFEEAVELDKESEGVGILIPKTEEPETVVKETIEEVEETKTETDEDGDGWGGEDWPGDEDEKE